MEDKEDFLKQMEDLKVPGVMPPSNQNAIKMAIMNAERSAALGVWLIVVPCYFLLCVFMYYNFHVHISWFQAMFTLISSLDKGPYIDFLAPVVLVVLPIICIVINSLSILHVQYEPAGQEHGKAKEFMITIKIKLWNILLILLSLAVVLTFVAYVMTENISIKN
jgi:lantibiotic transport system permease protein